VEQVVWTMLAEQEQGAVPDVGPVTTQQESCLM